ncbi:MAG: hypothetical protein JO056_06170 [Alphaproteobacteria bacterium]|uniref:hypothetical protein n=1 Tax=Bradyrhizobium sp. TaxID=376 RepID=UPI001ECF1DF7|nr:hypothetical protein [Bradyrhizobium sp.]MBV9570807.1 hypothetical protein [Alphaproteobacteria bacterium]MBV9979058.1 hypothetical protein [Bradyrhizobium sp.]
MAESREGQESLDELVQFINRIPGVVVVSSDVAEDGSWWVKLRIDIHHQLAWNIVQELGHILNYLSLTKRLPTVFMPVSAPPYLNGGPEEFLYWAIESRGSQPISPHDLKTRLEFTLPRPVDNAAAWLEPR